MLKVALERDHAVDVAFTGDGQHVVLLMKEGELRFYALPKQIVCYAKDMLMFILVREYQEKQPQWNLRILIITNIHGKCVSLMTIEY